jgi:hypothetical protein
MSSGGISASALLLFFFDGALRLHAAPTCFGCEKHLGGTGLPWPVRSTTRLSSSVTQNRRHLFALYADLWRYSPSELAVPRIYKAADVRSNREDMKLALGGSAAW